MPNDVRLNVQEKQQEIEDENEDLKSDSTGVSNNSQAPTFSLEQQRLLNEIKTATSEFPNIQSVEAQNMKKVPEIHLRNEKFKDYYKPKEMSIGPIYAHYEELFKRTLKIKLTAKFSKESGQPMESLLNEIKTNIEVLIQYFSKELLTMSNDALIELLFLDGCSMLQFMTSYMFGGLREFNISNGQAALIKQDLFLLDNQIPFHVLRLLTREVFGHRYIDYQYLSHSFVMTSNILALNNFNPPFKALHVEPIHLLDLLRKILILDIDGHGHDFTNQPSSYGDIFETLRGLCITDVSEGYKPPPTRYFRNVSELKLAGIRLKPSYSHNLDISFSTRLFIIGHLKLPKLIVDNPTVGKLLNLIAFEMSLDNYDDNCHVTFYVNFMDLLIDSEQDVKELREAHIVCNHLSSDAEVAKLFNDLGSNCLAPPQDTYSTVKNEIQNHYERKIAIWMAEFGHNHLKSPWTIIALFAAVAILCLTGTQTWFTVNPK